jgi:hypothetical protein
MGNGKPWREVLGLAEHEEVGLDKGDHLIEPFACTFDSKKEPGTDTMLPTCVLGLSR